MNSGPDISRLAALIADPCRSMMLGALMDGRALTAGELSTVGGVTPQTASSHLAKLVDGGFLTVSNQGRHRYFKLASDSIADILENLMALSSQRTGIMPQTGPRDTAMRHARVCYDHLAGEMGVAMFDGLVRRKLLTVDDGRQNALLTEVGAESFTAFGIDIEELRSAKRPICRTCLDWSVRKPHLAGALGAALWNQILFRKWANRIENSRVVQFTPEGRRQFDIFIREDRPI